MTRIIRKNELQEILSVSEATLWRMEKRGELPPRRKLSKSGRAVGWLSTDIDNYLNNRPTVESQTQSTEQ